MTDRELVHQALDMLKQAKDAVADWGAYASEYFQHKHNLQRSIDDIQAQITALSERLAQPEQKPVTLPCCGYADTSAVKWNTYNQVVQCHNCGQTYTTLPRREWQGLTDEEYQWIYDKGRTPSGMMEMVEAKLKEKNT